MKIIPPPLDNVEPHISRMAYIAFGSKFPLEDGKMLVTRHAHLGLYEICLNAGIVFYFEKYPSLCGSGKSLTDAIMDSAYLIGHSIVADSKCPRGEMTEDCIKQLEGLLECFEVRDLEPD